MNGSMTTTPSPGWGGCRPFRTSGCGMPWRGRRSLERLDRVYALVLDCATAAFETGVRLGLALTAPDRP